MKAILASAFFFSSFAFAGVPMGPEAIEMARVLTHPQVKECVQDVNMSSLINVQIDKQVYRCPGCVSYVISGNELNIDVPSTDKTVVKITGSSDRGFGGQIIQTYRCEVKKVSR
jgi:hypothetical protein